MNIMLLTLTYAVCQTSLHPNTEGGSLIITQQQHKVKSEKAQVM